MNTLALIAFLVGINNPSPAPPTAATEYEKPHIERTKPAPDKDPGGGKRRGGWDHN